MRVMLGTGVPLFWVMTLRHSHWPSKRREPITQWRSGLFHRNGILHHTAVKTSDSVTPRHFFFLAQQPNSGLSRLSVAAFRSHADTHTHTHTHTHPVGLLWTSDQPVAEAATYTGRYLHNTQQT